MYPGLQMKKYQNSKRDLNNDKFVPYMLTKTCMQYLAQGIYCKAGEGVADRSLANVPLQSQSTTGLWQRKWCVPVITVFRSKAGSLSLSQKLIWLVQLPLALQDFYHLLWSLLKSRFRWEQHWAQLCTLQAGMYILQIKIICQVIHPWVMIWEGLPLRLIKRHHLPCT